jgi:hypothetical protein
MKTSGHPLLIGLVQDADDERRAGYWTGRWSSRHE